MYLDRWKVKMWIYRYLVDASPYIRQDYAYAQERCHGRGARMKKLYLILKLNWKYRIQKKKPEEPLSSLCLPEGKKTVLPTAARLAEKLAQYEVVSFDIFDTLIFRAVEKPRDVFCLLEGSWNCPGFAVLREQAEQEARANKQEVTIGDIYRILSKQLSIDPQEGIRRELQMEESVCYANPYMYEVFQRLQEKGKKIIAVSDMYLPGKQMRRLLERCGYRGMQDVFVSCDFGKSKASGQLQRLVKKIAGAGLSCIHVGDQMQSDIVQSQKAGWDTFYYPNICAEGYPYRRKEMISTAASFYKGLVNAKMHAGSWRGSGYYEFGYVYGGILAAGFCQYLHRIAVRQKDVLFLFAARDGFILHRLCKRYFPDMAGVYVPFSRFASYQITMERNWKRFLQYVVRPNIRFSRSRTLGQVMEICDIGWLKAYLERYGLRREMLFNRKVYEKVERIFTENIRSVIRQYQEQATAAKEYFQKLTGSRKHLCVVDIGWQGTSISCLKYFLEESCGMDVHVFGAVLGMSDREPARISLDTKIMRSYLFSTGKNHENLMRHTGKQAETDYRNLLVEILFTEDAPTFLKFEYDVQGKVRLVYGQKENNSRRIRQIQRGILDFCGDYMEYSRIFGSWLEICGQEAYLPLDALAEARSYCLKLLGNYEINENCGMLSKGETRRFADITG